MDEIVKAAIAKWPNVPAVRGWLGLDARGDWWLRDEAAQRAGPFPRVKGSRIEHAGLRSFLERNYLREASSGAWCFQNGPQRVYVELEAAPWIWRVSWAEGEARIVSHTGLATRHEAALADEHGRLFVATPLGLGLVHTLDMDAAGEAVASGAWPVANVRFETLPARFGYVPSPAAAGRVGSGGATSPG